MKKNTNADTDELLFEAFLKAAADDALREEMEALPEMEELRKLYPRTKSLDRKVYAIVAKEKRAIKWKRAMPIYARVAVGFALLLVVTTATLMGVEASRNYILNLFIDVRSDHVAFDFGRGNEISKESSAFILGYIPEGFDLIDSQTFESFNAYIFADDLGHQITINKRIGDTFIQGVDNEQREFSTTVLNGQITYIFETQNNYDLNILVWVQGEDTVTISANIDIAELLRIAEGLEVR